MFLVFSALFVFCAATASVFSNSDFDSPESGLVLLTFKTESLQCFACEVVEKKFDEMGLQYKVINLYEDISAGSRFLNFAFPAIFYKKYDSINNRIEYFSVELEDVKDSKFNSGYKKIYQYVDPNSIVAKSIGWTVGVTFPLYLFLKQQVLLIPEWVFIGLAGLSLLYLLRSFNEKKDEKEKKE